MKIPEFNLPETITGPQGIEMGIDFIHRYRLQHVNSFKTWLQNPKKEDHADRYLWSVGQVKDHLPEEFFESVFEAHPFLLDEAAKILAKKNESDPPAPSG